MNISKEAVKIWSGRAGLAIAALFVLFLLGFCIWLLRPLREVPPWKLVPPTSFAYFSFNLDPAEPVVSDLLAYAVTRAGGADAGKLKSSVLRKALVAMLPTRIVGLVDLDEESGQPQLVLIVSMKKMARLLRIVPARLDRVLFRGAEAGKVRLNGHGYRAVKLAGEGFGPAAYTIAGNSIVIGTSLSAVTGAYLAYAVKPRESTGSAYLSGLLMQSTQQRGGQIYADNSGGRLSEIFDTIQEKLSFAAFPSVDAVASVMGQFRFAQDGLHGDVSFYCSDRTRIQDVRSDVKFIYGAVRRVLRASDIDMKGSVDAEESSVRFDFSVVDIMNAFVKGDEQ
jgi:hypothetical protein